MDVYLLFYGLGFRMNDSRASSYLQVCTGFMVDCLWLRVKGSRFRMSESRAFSDSKYVSSEPNDAGHS